MEIDEFLETVKKHGPDICLPRNTCADIVSNNPDIPIRSDFSKKCVKLKLYYDKDKNKYRYSEDNRTWTDLSEEELTDIFYRDIKPFIV